MKQSFSYKVKILGVNKLFTPTFYIFREAVRYLIRVVQEHWDEIQNISDVNSKYNYIESLVHSTKNNTAFYNFDNNFYKFPSYLRRAAIAEALGKVTSFVSNGNKVEEYKVSKKQRFMPVLYKDGSFHIDESNNTAEVKVFVNNDWVWHKVKLRKTDVDYIKRKGLGFSAPRLCRKHGRIYLVFSYEKNVELSKNVNRVLGVDLGINQDAVCSVINTLGTVEDRFFINFKSDKDRMYKLLEQIKENQSQNFSAKNIWSYVRVLNDALTEKIAQEIVSVAQRSNADVIVFEHLDMRNKKRGKNKQVLHMWRKNGIQRKVEYKAHMNGIRISRVCAYNTSGLAFDGSGRVQRGVDAGFKNSKLCRFSNGKVYNSDLSASYNIGARYLIRYLEQKLSAKNKRLIQAKVPELTKRSTCTLNTLLNFNAELTTLGC